jgi:photosystem II stability/assembly factor-like uncharacterized protein
MRGTRISKIFTIPAVALALAAGTAACGSAVSPSRPSAQTARHAPASGIATASVRADAAATLVSLAMSGPQRGYGLFERQVGGRCEAVEGRTLDGGAQFGAARLITSWNCNGNPSVLSIAADSSGDVFVYDPKLYIARNAGEFRSSPQRGTVLAVSAVGRSVWMLLDRCHGSGLSKCSLYLLESVSGGRTWHPARTQPPGGAGGGAPVVEPALGQTWLLRTGPDSGYVLASPASNGRTGSAPLSYTANGGRTWSRSRVPCGQDDLSVVLSRAPGGTLAAVCAGEPSAGSQGKMTTLSANGGRSWTKPVGCVFGQSCPDQVLFAGYLSQIAAVSASTVYLIGSRGPLLVTSDGGKRWRQVSPAEGPVIGAENGGIAQVVFFGRLEGVAVGDSFSTGVGQIWHTSDGGKLWSKPVVPQLG